MSQPIVPGRPPVGPFTLRQRLMELRFPAEYASFFALAPVLRRTYPLGEPHAILCLPGGLVGDGLTAILRWGLRRHGYDARGWGLGRNLGANEETLAGMRARVDELYAAYDAKITIIGWSLGGIYGRMLARDRPEKIRQVISMGSPFRMVESDRFAPFGRARWDQFVKDHAPEVDLLWVHEHDRSPLTVPATSIYSPNDGVAPWQLSIDETGPDAANPRAENVAVWGTHSGIGANPAAFAVVLDRLAQPEGAWKPFEPTRWLRHWYAPAVSWSLPADDRGGEQQTFHTE
jgi:pimeloyl-ACP methyl ester carboxylesterase